MGFIVKIKPHESDELWLKFENENQYCKWLAALKLGCKGITMASNNYKMEIDSLQQVIKIQDYSAKVVVSDSQARSFPSRLYVSKRHFRKIGQVKIGQHILSQHIEEAGLAYFQVAFKKDSRKEEYV